MSFTRPFRSNSSALNTPLKYLEISSSAKHVLLNCIVSSIGVGGTSTFFEKCSLTNPTLYYFPYNGFVFLISYF